MYLFLPWNFVNMIVFLCVLAAMSAEEVDIILQRSEGGVDSALMYAKTISKYMKDLIGYVEKKLALGRITCGFSDTMAWIKFSFEMLYESLK